MWSNCQWLPAMLRTALRFRAARSRISDLVFQSAERTPV
jgi:hypothetical protein